MRKYALGSDRMTEMHAILGKREEIIRKSRVISLIESGLKHAI